MINEIKALEDVRDSKIIVYVTTDRQNAPLNIEEDIIDVFHRALEELGDQERIDLFIYSRGGSTIVPLPLVRLIRKYCKVFGAIIPFRAHSAATMICVGADEIYMSRKAELGPVDPQLTINEQGRQRMYASTDLFAYLDFAREEIGWQRASMQVSVDLLEFFHKYCALPPDLIGKIYRMFTQSKRYIAELAESHHENHKLDHNVVSELAETLMRGFGSHDYKIDSIEAKNKLKLNVLPYSADLELKVSNLYAKCADELDLGKVFSPQPGTNATYLQGLIQTERSRFEKRMNTRTVQVGPQTNVDVTVQPWVKL